MILSAVGRIRKGAVPHADENVSGCALQRGLGRTGARSVVAVRTCRVALEHDLFGPDTVVLRADPHLVTAGARVLLLTLVAIASPVYLLTVRQRTHLQANVLP